MSKMTVLEMVQDILNDMSSDDVNSIDDTIESEQVAAILRSTYMSIIASRNWPHTKKLIKLSAFSDSDYPTHMSVPENVKELCFVNYNVVKSGETRLKYRPIRYVDNESFLRRCNGLNTDSDNVDIIVDPTGVQLAIRNDIHPSCFTSFDDETLVFDSYDSSVDSTLQASKVQAMAYVTPDWSQIDSFVPDLPEEAFPQLLSEAKSVAFIKIKQEASQKDEQESLRQRRIMSRKSWVVAGGVKYPNYGRHSPHQSSLPFDNTSYKDKV